MRAIRAHHGTGKRHQFLPFVVVLFSFFFIQFLLEGRLVVIARLHPAVALVVKRDKCFIRKELVDFDDPTELLPERFFCRHVVGAAGKPQHHILARLHTALIFILRRVVLFFWLAGCFQFHLPIVRFFVPACSSRYKKTNGFHNV